MRVLILASTFPRYEGDTEPRFIFDLGRELTKFCKVTVLAPAAIGAKDYEIIDGVEIIRYRYFPIKKCETLCYPGAIMPRIKEKKIRALLVPFLLISMWIKIKMIEKNYDIVNAHWVIPQGIVQSYCSRPFIITGHGADVTSLNHGIIKKLKKRALKKASFVTVVSSHLRQILHEQYQIEGVKVQPMGVRAKEFIPGNRIENYFGQQNRKVVLYVGRLAEKKGVKYLIDAMKEVDAKLVIVGDGPLKEELEQQAAQVDRDIVFMGKRNHDELKTIFASADAFAAPSITAKDGDEEGVPVSIIEAMASGVPVLSTKSGGIADLIKNEVNGIMVKEKDSKSIAVNLSRILCEPELAHRLSRNALQTAGEYDYAVIARNYYEMYQSMLGMKGTE